MRRAAVPVLAGLALVTAGCADPPDPLEREAALSYPRLLQAERQVEVRVLPATSAETVVVAAELDSALFAPARPERRTVRVWPGHEARLRVPLGAPRCPPGADAATEAVVAIDMVVEGEERRQAVSVDAAELARINVAECAMRAVAVTAPVSLGPPGAATDGALASTLVIERAGAEGPVTVVDAAGSVIFSLEPGPALPAVLGPGERRLEIPVSISVARCDPHAVAESKKTFLFKAWLAVEGADEVYVEVYARGRLRDALRRQLDACVEREPAGR